MYSRWDNKTDQLFKRLFELPSRLLLKQITCMFTNFYIVHSLVLLKYKPRIPHIMHAAGSISNQQFIIYCEKSVEYSPGTACLRKIFFAPLEVKLMYLPYMKCLFNIQK